MFWYCLPDSCPSLHHISRDFVPGYSRFARYCLPDKSCCLVVLLSCCLVVWLSGVVCRFGWKPIPSAARVTRDEVSGLRIRRKELSGRQYLIDNALTHLDVFVCFGTVFQTAVPPCIIYPETSSRVTLASLGIVFQTNLVVLLSCCLVVWLSGVVFQTNLIVLYKKNINE